MEPYQDPLVVLQPNTYTRCEVCAAFYPYANPDCVDSCPISPFNSDVDSFQFLVDAGLVDGRRSKSSLVGLTMSGISLT
jgi:ferredoxin